MIGNTDYLPNDSIPDFKYTPPTPLTPPAKERINHPDHYGGGDNIYETIKVIEAWNLDFHLGNTVKYISRAGKKDPSMILVDLEKASWYLNRKIEQIKKSQQ